MHLPLCRPQLHRPAKQHTHARALPPLCLRQRARNEFNPFANPRTSPLTYPHPLRPIHRTLLSHLRSRAWPPLHGSCHRTRPRLLHPSSTNLLLLRHPPRMGQQPTIQLLNPSIRRLHTNSSRRLMTSPNTNKKQTQSKQKTKPHFYQPKWFLSY